MHTELFYHKGTCTAYAVLPGCDDRGILEMEIQLLENNLGLEAGSVVCYEHRRIAEGPYWGHSVLKFGLHPSELIGSTEWQEITKENAKILRPEPYKLLVK